MNNESIAWCLEDLIVATEQLETAHEDVEKDYNDVLNKISLEEKTLNDRLEVLSKKMDYATELYGNINASGDDLLEINAGGKIIVIKRSILTLPRTVGTRFHALFSGRYENLLQRDSNGRIFLDVNSDCFQAIITYLNELIITEKGQYPSPPCVDDEYISILWQQINMFGLWGGEVILPPVQAPSNSYIIPCQDSNPSRSFVAWLQRQGLSGYFSLRYRVTRDGLTSDSFCKRCDQKSLLIFILHTNEKYIEVSSNIWNHYVKKKITVGKCSDTERQLMSKLYSGSSDRSTLELLAKLPSCGVVGNEGFCVCSEQKHWYSESVTVLDLEVFEVFGSRSEDTKDAAATAPPPEQNVPVTRFLDEINSAINKKLDCFLPTMLKLRTLEVGFREEHSFVNLFASGDAKDVITLNVLGTMMTTKRSTLRIIEDSVLARQFDDSMWTEHGYNSLRVKNWSSNDVCAWVKTIEGIPEEVCTIFKNHAITGCELLALSIDRLKMLGIDRSGTLCLLQKEIEILVKASEDTVTLIDHCPYCFGKILDFLRLKQLYAQGLAKEEPALPDVRDVQKQRFERVANFYFPGDAANLILGV